MKVLPFTIPVPPGKTIIVQEEVQSYFYPHLHRHAELQVTWIKRGEGTLLAGNGMHPFSTGEIYVLGANLPHLFKSNPEYFNEDTTPGIEAITIFFDPAGKLAAMFNLPEMETVRSFFEQWQSGFKIPADALPHLTDHIGRIQQTRGALQVSVFVEMLNAMSGLTGLQPLSSASYSYSMTDTEGMRIASVYNYVMQNYNNTIKLDDVARLANLTPTAFCRYFKQHTRVTFSTFVNKVRVEQACKLLVNGSLNNTADVAYSCGFSSSTNFNLVFKNITGKSPRAYVSEYSGAVQSKGK